MFSICIPNFNYGIYLGKTLQSVLNQTSADFEIVIADNASTDNSIEVIQQFQKADSRIRFAVNNRNVGFAGNLKKASQLAKNEWRVMLSSDDLMDSKFLAVVQSVIGSLGFEPHRSIISTTQNVIDANGRLLRAQPIDGKLWKATDVDKELSSRAGVAIYRVPANEMLRRSLTLMRTPFTFASTVYHETLFKAVEGYSQTAIINPDKKFAWAILAKATDAILIDSPLISYRVHDQAQGAQQRQSGALKHLTDEYIATFETEQETLEFAGITRDDLVHAFLEHDIALRGLTNLASGDRVNALRHLRFGQATFPRYLRKSKYANILNLLLWLGPLGVWLAKYGKARALKKWEQSHS